MPETRTAKEKLIAKKMDAGEQLTDEELAFYIALNKLKQHGRGHAEREV